MLPPPVLQQHQPDCCLAACPLPGPVFSRPPCRKSRVRCPPLGCQQRPAPGAGSVDQALGGPWRIYASGMEISAEKCQVIAQIAPVLILAVAVDRRDIARLVHDSSRRPFWLTVVRTYLALLAAAMFLAVSNADDGLDGFLGWLLSTLFWLGVGGTLMILWMLVGSAGQPGTDSTDAD